MMLIENSEYIKEKNGLTHTYVHTPYNYTSVTVLDF